MRLTLLGGPRLPLNAFAREILHRLGIGINQLNPMHGGSSYPCKCCGV